LFDATADWWCTWWPGFVPVTGRDDSLVGRYGRNYVAPEAREVAFLLKLPAPSADEHPDNVLAFRTQHSAELARLRAEIRRLSATVSDADEVAEAAQVFGRQAGEALTILTQRSRWNARLVLTVLTAVGFGEMKSFLESTGASYVDEHHLGWFTLGGVAAAGSMAVGEVAWKGIRTALGVRSLRHGSLGYLAEARLDNLV
jgi:hypothetical protein